jgi:hypothetical protein
VQFDAETLSHIDAAAIATNEVIAGQLNHRIVLANPQRCACIRLRECNQFRREPCRGIAMARQVFAQKRLENGLPEGTAARIAVFQRGRLDLEKTPPGR